MIGYRPLSIAYWRLPIVVSGRWSFQVVALQGDASIRHVVK